MLGGYPIAAKVYCSSIVQILHVQPGAAALRQRFGSERKDMQHRYQKPSERWVGEMIVSDAQHVRNSGIMFLP